MAAKSAVYAGIRTSFERVTLTSKPRNFAAGNLFQ